MQRMVRPFVDSGKPPLPEFFWHDAFNVIGEGAVREIAKHGFVVLPLADYLEARLALGARWTGHPIPEWIADAIRDAPRPLWLRNLRRANPTQRTPSADE